MSSVKEELNVSVSDPLKTTQKLNSEKTNNSQNQNAKNNLNNRQNNKKKKKSFNNKNQNNSGQHNSHKINQHQNNKFNKNQTNDNFNKNSEEDNKTHHFQNGLINSDYRPFKVILGQPTLELPIKESYEAKKFTGRCRIFVANLPNNTTEEALRRLFEEFGEVSEVYLGKSNFAFVKMDTRKNAEIAKNTIDGKTFEGRILRVRLAAHAAALRVKNLSNSVTNELLEYAFSYFGEVERAIVITDDRGRSIGEGIVEFARKFSAQNCLKKCMTDCFLLTAIPKPVFVEPFEQRDEEEGFPEKQINKNTSDFRQEREIGPRFAEPGTFEHEYSVRWMKLIELEKQKKEALDLEIAEARKALQEQLEYARVEHQTKVLREQLREMEERADKFGQLRHIRIDEERRKEEDRQKKIVFLRQQEEEIIRRSQIQDVSNLRRQENDLRSKANALQNILDKQEQVIGQIPNPMLVSNEQQIYQNRLNFNEQIGNSQNQINQQPIFNSSMPMIPNNPMNTGLDFNRYGPASVPPAVQPGPFNSQNSMPSGINGPFNNQRNFPSNQINNRFNNSNNSNNNNRSFQQGNINQQKRMRRY